MDLHWHEIEPHQIHIRGVDSSLVTLVAKSLLATKETRSDPMAIAFTGTIAISHQGSLNIDFTSGFYGDLATFRSELFAIRNGELRQAGLNMEHFCLTLYPHQCGARSGIVVEGKYSSDLQLYANPRPKHQHGVSDLVLKEHEGICYNIHFAFRTSQIDPPHLDNTIKEIDQLCAYIDSDQNTSSEMST